MNVKKFIFISFWFVAFSELKSILFYIIIFCNYGLDIICYKGFTYYFFIMFYLINYKVGSGEN